MNNEVKRIVQQTEALLRLRHEETLRRPAPGGGCMNAWARS
ncbi:MAG: hypothetical protein V8T00_04365 [Oscillospiraceae bacterium]